MIWVNIANFAFVWTQSQTNRNATQQMGNRWRAEWMKIQKKRNIRFCHHIVILFFLPHFHHSSQTNININLSVRCTHTIKTVLQCSFAKHFLAISWNEVYLLQTHTYVCMWVCVLCVCKHFIRPTFSWSNICTHALTLFVLLYVAAGEFCCFLFVW